MKQASYQDAKYKVITLGQHHVGKRSILTRYFENSFYEQPQQICRMPHQKIFQTTKGPIKLEIWVLYTTKLIKDPAGQEKYFDLPSLYFRNSDAAIIVYDITVEETFKQLERWIKRLKECAQNENIIFVIVGNKCDLQQQRVVKQIQIDELCNYYNVKHFEVSAKSGLGISEVLDYLAVQLIQVDKKTKSEVKPYQINEIQKINRRWC